MSENISVERRLSPEVVARETTARALNMAGIFSKKETASLEKRALLEEMTVFVIDSGSKNYLPASAPLPQANDSLVEGIRYDNREIKPVPVLSSAMISEIAKNDAVTAVTMDGTGIYSHNQVSSLEADKAIRRMLTYLNNVFGENNVIGRLSGDLFVVMNSGESNLLEDLQSAVEGMENVNHRDDLVSFRVNTEGEVVLDIARMHVSEPQIPNDRMVIHENENSSLADRKELLLKLHSSTENIVELISKENEDTQKKLLSIVENSLYDRLLQRVADKQSTEDFPVRIYGDISELKEAIVTRDTRLAKLDIASVLKTANDEPGFGEPAGDALLTTIFDLMIDTIKDKADAITFVDQLHMMRRWGDFYFSADNEDLKLIGSELLKKLHETPYAEIKPDDKGGYAISLLKTPNEVADRDAVVLTIPLMPIFAIDSEIKLHAIDETTEPATRDMLVDLNARELGVRMKVLDDEVRVSRARLVGEFLEKPYSALIDFLLFKSFNPNDPKRGLPRLKGLLKASDQQIQKLQDLMNVIAKDVDGDRTDSSAKRLYQMSQELTKSTATKVLNIFRDLTKHAIENPSLIKNGVVILTYDLVAASEKEIDEMLKRATSV